MWGQGSQRLEQVAGPRGDKMRAQAVGTKRREQKVGLDGTKNRGQEEAPKGNGAVLGGPKGHHFTFRLFSKHTTWKHNFHWFSLGLAGKWVYDSSAVGGWDGTELQREFTIFLLWNN